MTPPLAPPLAVPGHEYTRDRAPYDCPIGLAQWRYRWSCGCGATGRWQTTSTSLAYRGWRQHLKNLRTRGKCKA
jgi:hypothetical protein